SDLRWRAHVLGAAALAGALALAGPARAADPTPADRETARTLWEEGFNRRDQNDLKGALESFKAADILVHAPTTWHVVARKQAALGQLVEARYTLQALLRNPAKPGESPAFAEARNQATQMNDDLGLRIPSLRVTLKGVPDGSKPVISVDGVDV